MGNYSGNLIPWDYIFGSNSKFKMGKEKGWFIGERENKKTDK